MKELQPLGLEAQDYKMFELAGFGRIIYFIDR